MQLEVNLADWNKWMTESQGLKRKIDIGQKQMNT
jgi:hypothetical protein